MLEVSLLFLIMFLIAACAFFPLGYSMLSFSKSPQQAPFADKVEPAPALKMSIPEDSTLRRHFLTHLQSEIEAVLCPRPTDSVLRRHYDGLVAAELENCLAALAE